LKKPTKGAKKQWAGKLKDKYSQLPAATFLWLPKKEENIEKKAYSQTLKRNAKSSHLW